MRNLSKNKNLIISILLLIAFVAAAFCLAFLPSKQTVYADNYGELQDAGNYVYNNVSFYAIKIKKGSSYTESSNGNFPTGYELSLKDGKIQTVKYGETVLLDSDESLLVAFARQDEPGDSKEQALVDSFDSVDFLSATLKFNGKNPVEAPIGQTGSAKFFAYVVDLEKVDNEEGLVEFGADYQEISGAMAHYDFKFYVFNKSTYQRTEAYNSTLRPNTSISADYVVDKQNASKFYAEYFYNYQNQNLVTLTYNPQRYELEITKTIHSASTKYSFSYDVSKRGIDAIVYSNVPSLSTNEIYSRDLSYKLNDENVEITFKDLGVYQISYKAVYYNQNNTKTYLESLNEEYNKQDRLTIFGVQSTYNDYELNQTEFRSGDISADITGKANVSISSDITLSNVTFTEIASSNQPQIEFLFDATFDVLNNNDDETKKTFNVYYFNDSQISKNENSYTISFTNDNPTQQSNPKLTDSGYYFVKVTYTFDRYKEWLGSSSNTNTTKEFTQYFLFRIKDQTPTIDVKDKANNNIMSGYFDASGNYHGSFVSTSIYINNREEQTFFDMPTTLSLQKRAFGTDPNGENVWQNVSFNDESLINISNNGHYRLTINFGNNSTTMRYFDVDKDGISGIKALNVDAGKGGNQYYYVDAENYAMAGNKVFTTSKPFTLFWNDKQSGAVISASYVRYSMDNFTFNIGDNSANKNHYILDLANGYIAADSKISISNNPSTTYNKAESRDKVTANEVLNLPGLYIFKIEDEAGNKSYFSIILDNSTPTVLQATNNEVENYEYKIINSFNNIASDTRVYFGKKKLVLLNGLNLGDLTENLKYIFDENAEEIFNSRFVQIGENYYAYFDISGVEKRNITDGSTETLSLENGYDIIILKKDNGNIIEETYIYTITDESSNVKNHSVSVNTEKTGLAVYYLNEQNKEVNLFIQTTKTTYDDSKTIKYLRSTSAEDIKITWETLYPNDLDAFVDLENDGLIIKYYQAKYDSTLKTYKYDVNPTNVINVASIADAIANSNGKFTFSLNSVDGRTLAGKYEIIRTYSAKNSADTDNLKTIVSPDYVTATLVFYVDRNNVITAPNASGEQVGAYAKVEFFDRDDGSDEEYTDLFKQSQNKNSNPVVITNKLPVGIYIPVSQYGYENGLNFIDKTEVLDVDSKVSYKPFATKVSVRTPDYKDADGDYYAVYHYSYAEEGNDKNKIFWKLSSYEVFTASGKLIRSGSLTASNVITNNVLTGNEKYIAGEYQLIISSLENPDINATNKYLHNFIFKFKVVDNSPEFDITVRYEDLSSIDEKLLSQAVDGKYYTNADELLISWVNSNNELLAKIDVNSIVCEYNNGTKLTIANGLISCVNNTFVVNLPVSQIISTSIKNIKITMSFEGYGNSNEFSKYFAGEHTITKTIVFDREAPNATVETLRQADLIVGNNSNVNRSAVRTIGDRYNISSDAGIYRYYSFATDLDTLKDILFSSTSNSLYNTAEVFVRKLTNKYSEVSAIEIGSPLDKNSSPSNVFNWQIAKADTTNWKYVDSAEKVETAFSGAGYYEIVELDYAGNTTIYSVYIKDENSAIEVSYSYKDAESQKDNETISFTSDNLVGEVNSFSFAKLNKISYKDSSYGFIKFSQGGKVYLITPYNSENSAYRIVGDNLSEISLSNIELVSSNKYVFEITNAVAGENYTLTFNVSNITDVLDVRLAKDTITQTGDIGITVVKQNSIEIKEITIYALNKESGVMTTYTLDGQNKILTNDYGTRTTYYVCAENKSDWNNTVFLIVYTDNYGRQNHILESYLDINFDRYEGSADLTENMQSLSNIFVSAKDFIYFNEKIDSEVTINILTDNGTSTISSIYEINQSRLRENNGYYGYKLEAVPVVENNSSSLGGMVEYEITVKENLSDFDDVYDADNSETKKVYNVIIYNQTPRVTLRNAKGEDITQALFNKTQTHSGKLFISYESLENLGYTSVVMLRKRGSSEGYVEIPTSYSISDAGTYDIKIFNRNSNGSLAYSYEKQFTIANYDVNFYSVVAYDASNSDNPYRIIQPTGKIFEVDGEKINYHYIINTSTYEISVNNGVVAKLLTTKNEGKYTNYVYLIESQTLDAGSSIKFSRKIVITVLNDNSNILNEFSYYLGSDIDYSSVIDIDVRTDTTNIYVRDVDEFNFVTLQWNSYYILPENKIFYQISNDGGNTFSEKIESGDEETTSITLTKSGNYVLIFTDLAGNIQYFSDLDNGVNYGVKDRYNINFIKSVIFLINDENPIDNAIYNEKVTVSIPSSTLSYYEDKPAPTIHVERNGEEYPISNNKLKTYEFTESGRYVIYFTATKQGNEIGIEKYTFTIINPNDSRWAFSYQNYNGYTIDYIKYNGTDFDLSSVLVNDEIIMSVIGDDALDNGIYKIKMSTTSIPVQSFEFDVWLNNTTPSIVVSIAEGTTTTGDVELKLNTINLYDMVGDCVVMVNDQEILRINSEYFESEDFTENFTGKMTETGVYYIQVYTSSDKLIYSYKVEIVDPLNTVTIILIVVGSVAVVVGVVLFLLLRKKLRIR